MKHRNPYVILGIPFGSSAQEARSALAAKSASSRDATIGTADESELEWALSQVEAHRDPTSQLGIYRIPADPAAMAVDGEGILAPRPERLQPSRDDRDAAIRALQLAAAQEVMQYLVLVRSAQLGPPQH